MARRSWTFRFCRRYGYLSALSFCGLMFLVLAIHVTKNQFILIVDVHNEQPVYRHLPPDDHQVVRVTREVSSVSRNRALFTEDRTGLHNLTAYSQERLTLLLDTIQVLKQFNHKYDGNYTKKDLKGITCNIFNREGKLERVVANNIWAEKNTYFEDDVTLVTQFTLEKTTALNMLMNHWNGPISAALYIDHSELNNIPIMFKGFPKILTRENLDLHIVLKNGTMYPVNYLRNVAINNTLTPFVFLIDIDFMPSFGLYEYLMELIPTTDGLYKQALVVPAMEYLMQAGMFFPRNKTELTFLYEIGVLVTSQSIHWPPSHRATNYSLWFNSTQPFEVFYEEGYEPYIVTRKEGLPLYNTKFLGGFRDKVAHTLVLNATGYSFVVIPGHFAIHVPHHREPRPPYYKCSMIPYANLKAELGIVEPTVSKPVTSNTATNGTSNPTNEVKKKKRVIRIIRRVKKKPQLNSSTNNKNPVQR